MMAWTRSATCSLVKMFETQLPTVFVLKESCLALGEEAQDLALTVGERGEGPG
jgi:hypothetical protein